MPHLQKRCVLRTEDLPGLIQTRTIAMSDLRVCVSLLSGEQCCFALTRTATAWDLQGAIKEKLGIRRRYQQLVAGVDLLCGNTMLSQFAPQELEKITLVITEARACDACGVEGRHKMCARCRSAFYCGTRCQRVAWRVHRRTCRGQ